MNEFGDLHNEEFKRMYTGFGRPRPTVKTTSTHRMSGLAAPDAVDWRTEGKVSLKQPTRIPNLVPSVSCYSRPLLTLLPCCIYLGERRQEPGSMWILLGLLSNCW